MSIQRIAVTLRIVEATSYVERRDALAHDWQRWLKSAFPGAALLPLPNDPDGVRHWLGNVRPDGIILSGGNDWGEYLDRDETELAVIRCALEAGTPVLGVCRGLQVLNVYFGGGLCDAINQRPGSERHVARTHPVNLDSGWAERFGVSQRIMVNSYHTWGVLEAQLASELRAFALAPDGVVEGVYHPARVILGIQWHPERDDPSHEFNTHLINRFFRDGAFWKQK